MTGRWRIDIYDIVAGSRVRRAGVHRLCRHARRPRRLLQSQWSAGDARRGSARPMRACSSSRFRAMGAPRSAAGQPMALAASAAKSRPMASLVAGGPRSGSIPRSSSIRYCRSSVSGSSSAASVATRRCCRAHWSPPPPRRRRARRCPPPTIASARASGVSVLAGAQLQSEGPARVLGFAQRAEMLGGGAACTGAGAFRARHRHARARSSTPSSGRAAPGASTCTAPRSTSRGSGRAACSGMTWCRPCSRPA